MKIKHPKAPPPPMMINYAAKKSPERSERETPKTFFPHPPCHFQPEKVPFYTLLQAF
jgi:hypothetical protein